MPGTTLARQSPDDTICGREGPLPPSETPVMSHFLLLAALAPLFVQADTPLAAGTQLNFRGSVEPGSETTAAGRKAFDLTLWIAAQNETGAEILWLLEERGRGEFPWPARFGRVSVDRLWRAGGPGPALLYDRGDGRSVLPIPLPFLAGEQPLVAGAKFHDGKFELTVEKPSKTVDRASWKVGVRDPFGPRRTLYVDQASPLVLAGSNGSTGRLPGIMGAGGVARPFQNGGMSSIPSAFSAPLTKRAS